MAEDVQYKFLLKVPTQPQGGWAAETKSARASRNMRSTQLLPVIGIESAMHHAEAPGYRCNA